jgi:serine/threonine protein kinase
MAARQTDSAARVSAADSQPLRTLHQSMPGGRALMKCPAWQVSSKIGKGAYGSVWQATVAETGEEVVVKVLSPGPC